MLVQMRYISVFILLIPIALFFYWLLTKDFSVSSSFTKEKPKSSQIPYPSAYSINEGKLWRFVNDWKEDEDGYRYIKSDFLCDYATERVQEVQSDWSHRGFEKTNTNKSKVGGFYNLGENLARYSFSEYEMLNEWLNSSSHRKNLDSNYTHSCIKCLNNHCVQLFGKHVSKDASAPQVSNVNSNDKITCTGPDGKQFQTTQTECDAFNKAWGNTPAPNPDRSVKCEISPNCGGGYREMSASSCERMTCCQANGTWELRDKDQCNKEQKQQADNEHNGWCEDFYKSNYERDVNFCEVAYKDNAAEQLYCKNKARNDMHSNIASCMSR